jgi:hypothetical protein
MLFYIFLFHEKGTVYYKQRDDKVYDYVLSLELRTGPEYKDS